MLYCFRNETTDGFGLKEEDVKEHMVFKVENIKPRDKWYSLYDKVFAEQNLAEAWAKVRESKGAGGVDRVTIGEFDAHHKRHIQELSRILQEKTFHPLLVRRVYIPKPDGTKRPLGIPAIRDRVVQQALKNILEPIFEPTFQEASYGFRQTRSPHKAIERVEQYLKEGYQWAVDADIKDFFGTLDHELLLNELNRKIADGSILKLIRAFLQAGIMEEGTVTYQVTGTPQGGVISPLLSNIYLNTFDWEITKQGYKLVRYCDDWIILCNRREVAERALSAAATLLSQKKLTLKAEKTRIVHHREGFEFLGFWFKDYDGIHRKGPRKRAIASFQDKVRHVTRRQQPRNIKMLVQRINPIIRGWGLYFRIGDVKTRFTRLDEWTRMRLRSFIAKKHSRSLQAHLTYRNQYFKDLGFVFLSDLIMPSFPATGQRYR